MQDEWAGFTRAQGLVGLGAAGKACLSLRKGTARKSWSDALGEVDAIEVQQGGRWCHRAACRGRRPRSAEYRGDGLLAIRVVDEASVLVQTTRSVRSHDDHHLSVGTCSRHFAVPANDNSNCLTSQVSVQGRAGMVSPQHGGLRKSVHLHHKLLEDLLEVQQG
jgi:hypothetical protein